MMRTDSPSWIQRKAQGDAGELQAAAALRAVGCGVFRALEGLAPREDLMIWSNVEVKTDLASAKTGNVAVEIARGGKPSGLSATRAAWWIFVACGEVVAVPVERLARAINAGAGRTKLAGDNRRSVCVLLPVAEIRRLALFTLPVGEGR